MVNKFIYIALGVLFFLGFIVVGPIIYLTGFSQILWLLFFVGMAIFFGAIYFGERFQFINIFSSPPCFILALLAFLISLVCSLSIDTLHFGEIVISSRWYFFVWTLMLVFGSGLVDRTLIDYLWRFLLVVALIQFPVAVAQYVLVSLSSERVSPWDAVIGTFPGSVVGGGQSAAMGIFSVIMMLLAYALWQIKKISGHRFAVQIFCGVSTLAFAEVKAAVLSLPLILLLYFGGDFLKRPREAALSVLVATFLSASLLWSYGALHYAHEGNDASPYTKKTVLGRVEHAVSIKNERSVSKKSIRGNSTNKQDETTRHMGRVTHLVYWARENITPKNVKYALLGHGIGSTQESRWWQGEVAQLYRYPMEVSSSVILLWETGLLGHLLFVLVFLLAARDSLKLSHNDSIPDIYRTFLHVGAVALVFLIVTLPYKNFVLRSVPVQLLIVLLLGQILYWKRVVNMKLFPDQAGSC